MSEESRVRPAEAERLLQFAKTICNKVGIFDQNIINAFAIVDRKHFVPNQRDIAYHDQIVRLNESGRATMTEPSLVAKMINALHLQPGDAVLEVGTGSGYSAAVIAQLAKEVTSIETDVELAEKARTVLTEEGIENVSVVTGDGLLGHAEKMPYSAIIIAAGVKKIPQNLIDQLAEGGRIVAPVGHDPDNLNLVLGIKHDGKLTYIELGKVSFVPLVTEQFPEMGWTERELLEFPHQP